LHERTQASRIGTDSRETLLRALDLLSEELGKHGVTGEIYLFGGTVMVSPSRPACH